MSFDPERRDLDRVRDIIAHACKAMEFAAAIDEATFRRSDLHQHAITRAVSIVGEAAYRTSAAFQAVHPDVPWRDMIRMRHKLVHDYGQVALVVVWNTVRVDLPPLVDRLRRILPP